MTTPSNPDDVRALLAALADDVAAGAALADFARAHARQPWSDATVYQYGLTYRRWAQFLGAHARPGQSTVGALLAPPLDAYALWDRTAPFAPTTRYADRSAIRGLYRALRAAGLTSAVPFPDPSTRRPRRTRT